MGVWPWNWMSNQTNWVMHFICSALYSFSSAVTSFGHASGPHIGDAHTGCYLSCWGSGPGQDDSFKPSKKSKKHRKSNVRSHQQNQQDVVVDQIICCQISEQFQLVWICTCLSYNKAKRISNKNKKGKPWQHQLLISLLDVSCWCIDPRSHFQGPDVSFLWSFKLSLQSFNLQIRQPHQIKLLAFREKHLPHHFHHLHFTCSSLSLIPSGNYGMAMENGFVEDVFPIKKNGDFYCHVSLLEGTPYQEKSPPQNRTNGSLCCCWCVAGTHEDTKTSTMQLSDLNFLRSMVPR